MNWIQFVIAVLLTCVAVIYVLWDNKQAGFPNNWRLVLLAFCIGLPWFTGMTMLVRGIWHLISVGFTVA